MVLWYGYLAPVAPVAGPQPIEHSVYVEDYPTTSIMRGEPNQLGVSALSTTGEQSTLLMLVNFADKPDQPYTSAQAQLQLDATSNFFRASSNNQTWLEGTVVGWYTIPVSSTVCDYNAISDRARNAAFQAGINLALYNRYVYAFPQNACGWWGFGSVGGQPSQAWINGPLLLQALGHEMGHNLGLYHAHSKQCGTTSTTEPCSVSDYGDTFDIMGNYATGQFNPFHKELLGWLAPAEVTSPGSYYISTYELVNGLPHALKITRSDGSFYYVESRQTSNGVLVRSGEALNANSSYLYDMTMASPWNFYDAALPLGATFHDPLGLSIRVEALDTNGATVVVGANNENPPPPPVIVPDFALTASNPTMDVLRGKSSVSVLSLINAGGFAGKITLKAPRMPRGLSVNLKPTTITGLGTSQATFKADRNVMAGTYPITITGTSGALTHTVMLTVVVF